MNNGTVVLITYISILNRNKTLTAANATRMLAVQVHVRSVVLTLPISSPLQTL